jgi:hypothetical protein
MDIKSATLKEVIKFIYTNKADIGDTQTAKEIIYAAKKFRLEALKTFCVDMLTKSLKKENVLHFFEIADTYAQDAKELEDKCLEIILE